MIKKTVFIGILISLLGLIALAEPEAAVQQDKTQDKAPVNRFQRIEQWSNELKAAYEAKDMDKIGELIKQMDDFKAKIKEERDNKKLQDGEKRGKNARRFSKRNRQNDDQCTQNSPNQWQDNDEPRHNRRDWQEEECDNDQNQYQQPCNRFAHKQGRGMRNQMRSRQECSCQNCCNMQRGFAHQGYGMPNQGQQWQGQGRCYQGEGFAGNRIDDGQMGYRQMRGQWQGQNQMQCPMNMQRQGNFCQNCQMARGFGNNQQGQCPMYQQQRGFNRPCNQQQPQQYQDNFGNEGFNRQGCGQNQVTPSGNEWEW